MKKRFLAGIIVATVGVAALLAQAPQQAGVGPATGIFRQAPAVTGPAPHLADGTPDLSGVCMGGGSNSGDITKGLKAGSELVMQPWAEKVFKERKSEDDPEALCLPFG